MKILKTVYLLFILLLLTPLYSQDQNPKALLIYADDETAMEIMDSDGNILEAYLGMEILEGSAIETFATSAELELYPSGSIIKISPRTLISLDDLQQDGKESNNITLGKGKFRAVIARLTGSEQKYNIFTSLAVCGIRGTDFVLDSEGVLVVADGLVEMTKLTTSEVVSASAGTKVDIREQIFTVRDITPEELQQVYREVIFEKLIPQEVPGKENLVPVVKSTAEEETEKEPEQTQEQESTEEPAEVQEESNDKAGDSPAEKTGTLGGSAPALQEATPQTKTRENKDPMDTFLGQILAMEAGSFTVNGKIYSKLVFQPHIQMGKLQAQLYLPFIYDQNIFDPSDWYKPEGNNEWSFGSDQSTVQDIAADAFHDLFLKIRYIKWGDRRDPFSFAFGNYNQVTLGHGILMQNYDNNSEFPSVRKVGLSLNAHGGGFGFEMVGEDFSTPLNQVIGARVAMPVLGPVSWGVSSVVDLDPAQNMDSVVNQSYIDKNPIFINFALDLELPVLSNDIFSLLVYTDGASMVPIMGGAAQWDYMMDTSQLIPLFKNYGASAGILGNLFMADYQLEYQYADGVFKHGFYNNTYDKLRGDYVKAISDYLSAPTSLIARQGIYGRMGFTLPDILYFSAGYRWPWTVNGLDLDDDYLQVELALEPLPVIGVFGSFTYARSGLAGAVNQGNATFIDANTVMKGELGYPVTESIGLSLMLTSAFERDSVGNLIFDGSGNPIPTYTMGINARLQY